MNPRMRLKCKMIWADPVLGLLKVRGLLIPSHLRISALLGEEPAHGRHEKRPDADPRLKFLSKWHSNTVSAYNSGSLFKERRDLLDEYHFSTTNYGRTTKADEWKQSFFICLRYFRANDFCYPPLDRNKCKTEIEKFVATFIGNSRKRIDPSDEGNWKVELLNSINFVWDWREEFPGLVDHTKPMKPLKEGEVIRKIF